MRTHTVTIYRYDNKEEISFKAITSWTFQGEYLVLTSNLGDDIIYFKQNVIAAFNVKKNADTNTEL